MERNNGWPEKFSVLSPVDVLRGIANAIPTFLPRTPLSRGDHVRLPEPADTGAEAMLSNQGVLDFDALAD